MNTQAGVDPATTSRRNFLIAAATLSAGAWVAPVRSAESASQATVTVERRGSDIVVEAHAEVRAALEQTWMTLADYDHLAEFIPDMAMSRTVSRAGTTAMVEQHTTASFGPFRQKLSVLLAVEETPYASISASVVQGDFHRFNARYDVVAIDAQSSRIDYHATLEPGVPVPPLVGLAVMRSQVRKQFEAMLVEIARRGALT